MYREMRLLQDIKDNGLDIEEDFDDEIDPTSEFDLGDELL
jgi:hypothetical protein